MDTIKRMLMETDPPMAAISEDCGFSNTSYFATYFRKAEGVSPRQFRNEYRGQREAMAKEK